MVKCSVAVSSRPPSARTRVGARPWLRPGEAVHGRQGGPTDDSRPGRNDWIVRLGCSRNTASQPAGTIAGRSDTHCDDLAAGGYDHEPLGQGIEALIWLAVAPHALAEAGAGVAGRSAVRFAAAVTGRTNLVVSALCRSTEELYAFLSEGIGALPGVHTAETVLTLRRVKTLPAERR